MMTDINRKKIVYNIKLIITIICILIHASCISFAFDNLEYDPIFAGPSSNLTRHYIHAELQNYHRIAELLTKKIESDIEKIALELDDCLDTFESKLIEQAEQHDYFQEQLNRLTEKTETLEKYLRKSLREQEEKRLRDLETQKADRSNFIKLTRVQLAQQDQIDELRTALSHERKKRFRLKIAVEKLLKNCSLPE